MNPDRQTVCVSVLFIVLTIYWINCKHKLASDANCETYKSCLAVLMCVFYHVLLLIVVVGPKVFIKLAINNVCRTEARNKVICCWSCSIRLLLLSTLRLVCYSIIRIYVDDAESTTARGNYMICLSLELRDNISVQCQANVKAKLFLSTL